MNVTMVLNLTVTSFIILDMKLDVYSLMNNFSLFRELQILELYAKLKKKIKSSNQNFKV